MNLTIPIYATEHRPDDGAASRYTVRPLFFMEPTASADTLGRATRKLGGQIRKHLTSIAKGTRERLFSGRDQFSHRPCTGRRCLARQVVGDGESRRDEHDPETGEATRHQTLPSFG